jgi:hypothetical protein
LPVPEHKIAALKEDVEAIEDLTREDIYVD